MKQVKGATLSEHARLLLHQYLDYVWAITAIESLKEPTASELSEMLQMKQRSTELADQLVEEIGVAEYIYFLESAIKAFSECGDNVDEFIGNLNQEKP